MSENRQQPRFPKKPASVRPLPEQHNQTANSPAESELFKRILQHRENYYRYANLYKWLYYGLRFTAAISAGLVPILVVWASQAAIVLSILSLVATVVDSVVVPYKHWKVYSKASDLLFLEQAKRSPDFEQLAEEVKLILETESNVIAEYIAVGSLVDSIKMSTQEIAIQPSEE